MTYRSQQTQGEGKSEDLDSFYKRKQSVKHNQLKGEAEVLHDEDTDCDARDNYSYGKGGYSREREKPRGWKNKVTEHSIWDDAPWDKEKP